jgi:hypothetical protein
MKKSLFLLLLLAVAAFGQRTEPASKSELAEITERGRLLYAYDQAAWHSTDAVQALSPAKGRIERYVARRSGSGWIVAYGKLNQARDRFLIAYEAIQGKSPKEFNVTTFDKPKEDSGFFLFAARAIEAALDDFGPVNRPYNVAVLPDSENRMFVYLVPAQTVAGVFPLGGDVRYSFSGDGLKLIEKRRLHKSIIEFSAPEGSSPSAGYHTAVLDDVPEDTDVFHVLAREPKIAEFVVTNKYVYRIAEDGTASYLMTREAFTRIARPQ